IHVFEASAPPRQPDARSYGEAAEAPADPCAPSRPSRYGRTSGSSAITITGAQRECPDTALAMQFEGVAMVQSFRIEFSDGTWGRCWISTAGALRVPGFGQSWVLGQLAARVSLLGWPEVNAQLQAVGGLRLEA